MVCLQMLGKGSDREAKIQVAKFFPWCPFCCYEPIDIDVQLKRDYDFIRCRNCGAKWEMRIRDKVQSTKLVRTSVDRKGKDLLQKEVEPEFWKNKAWLCILTRKIPERPT